MCMLTSSKFIVASSVAAALLLASCGSDFTADDVSDQTSTEAPAATDVPAETDVEPVETEVPASAEASTDGGEFTDPDGDDTITVGSEWTATPAGAVGDGTEAWAVASPGNEFTSNVNVLSQPAPGLDLASYLEASVENTGTFEVIDQATVTGENGNELGLLEFAGPVAGSDLELHFLAVVDVTDGTAVLATLSTLEENFEALRSSVEPFMLTLQAA